MGKKDIINYCSKVICLVKNTEISIEKAKICVDNIL